MQASNYISKSSGLILTEYLHIEIRITCQDKLQTLETEKTMKYDISTNELGLIYKHNVKIIPNVMTG